MPRTRVLGPVDKRAGSGRWLASLPARRRDMPFAEGKFAPGGCWSGAATHHTAGTVTCPSRAVAVQGGDGPGRTRGCRLPGAHAGRSGLALRCPSTGRAGGRAHLRACISVRKCPVHCQVSNQARKGVHKAGRVSCRSALLRSTDASVSDSVGGILATTRKGVGVSHGAGAAPRGPGRAEGCRRGGGASGKDEGKEALALCIQQRCVHRARDGALAIGRRQHSSCRGRAVVGPTDRPTTAHQATDPVVGSWGESRRGGREGGDGCENGRHDAAAVGGWFDFVSRADRKASELRRVGVLLLEGGIEIRRAAIDSGLRFAVRRGGDGEGAEEGCVGGRQLGVMQRPQCREERAQRRHGHLGGCEPRALRVSHRPLATKQPEHWRDISPRKSRPPRPPSAFRPQAPAGRP
ncbi:hypothetical protein DAEQUDRAFT_269758 [Daedalea quercina L-15889]|uniref:Uncharacterized protein n=1 Tax=Daedalea quercina L-15889 TaxID=1314783 RepID=A0A165QBR0_9APHY|nr:hypothetical protein DAEQUDRAFT_269758 [Daedalea quercina L-15889]